MTNRTEQRNNFSTYLREIGRLDLLTREQEAELARRWQQDRDQAAAEQLVSRNLRFVVKVARGYARYGVPLADLVQEGNLGLMHAVDKFDPSRGTRFLSYAVWWIKAYMQAHVIRGWSLVRIGTTQAQRRLFHKLPRALAAGRRDGEGHDEFIARLATEFNARPRDVNLMIGVVKGRDLSLDSPLRPGESDATFMDRVEDPGPGPELKTVADEDQNLRSRLLAEALEKLSERERAIIELRHCSDEPRTLREVGVILGLSRERIRQLENRALIKLRRLVQNRYELATAA